VIGVRETMSITLSSAENPFGEFKEIFSKKHR
jgi:hypothetical protein